MYYQRFCTNHQLLLVGAQGTEACEEAHSYQLGMMPQNRGWGRFSFGLKKTGGVFKGVLHCIFKWYCWWKQILHQLISSLSFSHCLQIFYIPGGAGFHYIIDYINTSFKHPLTWWTWPQLRHMFSDGEADLKPPTSFWCCRDSSALCGLIEQLKTNWLSAWIQCRLFGVQVKCAIHMIFLKWWTDNKNLLLLVISRYH